MRGASDTGRLGHGNGGHAHGDDLTAEGRAVALAYSKER